MQRYNNFLRYTRGKGFFYVKKWFLGSRRVFYAYKEDRMQKELDEREKQMCGSERRKKNAGLTTCALDKESDGMLIYFRPLYIVRCSVVLYVENAILNDLCTLYIVT